MQRFPIWTGAPQAQFPAFDALQAAQRPNRFSRPSVIGTPQARHGIGDFARRAWFCVCRFAFPHVRHNRLVCL
jgi:hypothetical protein